MELPEAISDPPENLHRSGVRYTLHLGKLAGNCDVTRFGN
jgi:hypothetical protein